MVAFTFALLAASVQGSANILATTPEFTLRKLAKGGSPPATGGTPAVCSTDRDERLGLLKYLEFGLPDSILEIFGYKKGETQTAWLIVPSALLGAATTVLLALKQFVFHKLISNFIATLALVITSVISAYSPLQTIVTTYGNDTDCLGFVTLFLKNDLLQNVTKLIAVFGNIGAIVMAIMGFNHVVTYAVAVAAYAATFYGNLRKVHEYFCNDKDKTYGWKAVEAVGLDTSLCPVAPIAAA